MRSSNQRRYTAAVLSALLVSCSATRYTAPTNAEELGHFVLIMEEAPDGRVSHFWRRAEDFELERYRSGPAPGNVTRRIVLAASGQTDCYAQYLECYQQCRETPVPPEFNQYLHDFGPRAGHDRYCSERCMRQYTECLKAQGSRIQEFTQADSAVDWLKRHPKSMVVGSLVVIAGVVFATVSAGAGVVVLAPLMLVTSSGAQAPSHIAAMGP